LTTLMLIFWGYYTVRLLKESSEYKKSVDRGAPHLSLWLTKMVFARTFWALFAVILLPFELLSIRGILDNVFFLSMIAAFYFATDIRSPSKSPLKRLIEKLKSIQLPRLVPVPNPIPLRIRNVDR
jgi:hypothetical protein